jgi:flagellar protein FliS
MNDTPANAYLRSKVLTAKPEELRLMLYDGALRFCRQGREALTKREHEAVFHNFKNAKNIVLEFISALDRSYDPELCSRLSALYTYMYRRLVDAGTERSVEAADEVIELLEYDRQTWEMLVEEVQKQRAAGTLPDPAEPQPAAGGSLSVQG